MPYIFEWDPEKAAGNLRAHGVSFEEATEAFGEPEYDFSRGVRGVTAARYREGTNIVLLDPDVKAVFPDSVAVNEALRTFARLIKPRRPARRRRSA